VTMLRARLIALSLLLLFAGTSTAPPPAARAEGTLAMLTVLIDTVTVVPAATGEPRPAVSGELLKEGDRVLVGTPGMAQLSFETGWGQDLDAGVEIQVHAVGQQGAGIVTALALADGVTVNRVAQAASGSSFASDAQWGVALASGAVFRVRVVRDPVSHCLLEEAYALHEGALAVRVFDKVVNLTPGQRLRLSPPPGCSQVSAANPPTAQVDEGDILTSLESGTPGGALFDKLTQANIREDLEAPTVDAMNAWRAAHQLAPFTRFGPLDQVARRRCLDMSIQRYLSHTPPGGGADYVAMLRGSGLQWTEDSENLFRTILRGLAVANAAAAFWGTDLGHVLNFINPHYEKAGVSVCEGVDGTYSVMLLLHQ
jgi:uncharacterized protein YkwD